MKLDRKWRGWRVIERVTLWTTCVACSFVAAQPLRDRWSAWQSQRDLEARWQQAQAQQQKQHEPPQQKRPRSRAKVAVSPSHSKAKARLVSRRQPEHPDTRPKQKPEDGQMLWPMTRLTCSRMKLDAVVVQGTDATQLKQGPGHEADTSLPGGPNCVVAAHRNAYGWWFYRLNELRQGDFVVLQTPGRKFLFRVAASRVVSVRDTSILHWPADAQAAPRLTLYSCTLPKTTRRLVVIANLANSEAT